MSKLAWIIAGVGLALAFPAMGQNSAALHSRAHRQLGRSHSPHRSHRRRHRRHSRRCVRALKRRTPVLATEGQTLRWTAVGSRDYRLYETPPGTLINVTGTTFTPRPLPGVTVRYKVAAAEKNSSWSNTVTISYGESPPPTSSSGSPGLRPSESTPLPLGIPGNWTLKFEDNFNAPGLNESAWDPCDCSGGQDFEINYVCNSTANVAQPGDGYLHLKLTNVVDANCVSTGGPKLTEYTGATVTAQPGATGPPENEKARVGFSYLYGVIEWRVYLQGTGGRVNDWASLYSSAIEGNWPEHGENDTMDAWNHGKACWGFQSPGSNGPTGCSNNDFSNGWHTFATDWQPGEVNYYYDGVKVAQLRPPAANSSTPQFPIMALGARNYGEPSTEDLVDYVRVWQLPSVNPTMVRKSAFSARTSCP
jgi:Glycosyl hydrolases family 16